MNALAARGSRWLPAATGVLLGYYVLLGETAYEDPHVLQRLLNGLVAVLLLVVFVRQGPSQADRVDKGVLVSLLFFAAAAVLAPFPRQAFDSLLTVLVFAAVLFVARSILIRDDVRLALVRTFMVLSATLTLLIAARWLLPVAEWARLTGWTVVPPLDMNFAGAPWGHRHDLALLIVMLYPSWWIGKMTPLRFGSATVIGILVALVVLVDGSRAVWLGVIVASAALLAPVLRARWPRDRRGQATILVAVALVALVVTASGVMAAMLSRALASTSLGMRGEMWIPLVDAWSSSPLAGYGPGSFPWILQTTDYFDTNALAPRHPDSAPVQLLAEGGILGLSALGILLFTLVPALLRSSATAARWVLATFAVACIFGNPSVFPHLVVVAIVWTAYALPRETDTAAPRVVESSRLVSWATLTCLVIASAAWVSTAIADVAYASARSAVASEDIESAIGQLELAQRLDPGMAIYARQLGTARLLEGDARSAIRDLETATRLNPSDQLAWRTLAIAAAESGDPRRAEQALATALEQRRSDPSNLLLAAAMQESAGDAAEYEAFLAEIVQAWPTTIVAEGWAEAFPASGGTPGLVTAAADRWANGAPSPQPRALQPVLLAIMAGDLEAAAAAANEALGPDLGPIYVTVMACQPNARNLIETAPTSVYRSPIYWSLALRQAALDGRADETASRLYALMTADSPTASLAPEPLNPLHENGADGYSADRWGYRRRPIHWPNPRPLPSPWSGDIRWLLLPSEAVAAADLGPALPECR